MSQVNFPTENDLLRKEDSINLILTSIAMEEAALSHILNAEGEKIQYILGTLEGSAPPELATLAELVEANANISETIDAANGNQLLLNGKLFSTLEATVMEGPPGPDGGAGLPDYSGATPLLSITDAFFPKSFPGHSQFTSGTPYIAADTGLLYLVSPIPYVPHETLCPSLWIQNEALLLTNGELRSTWTPVQKGDSIQYFLERTDTNLFDEPILYENLDSVDSNLWFIPLK